MDKTKKKYFNIEHKSLDEIGVKTYQELWTKAQAEGYQGLAVSLSMSLEKATDKENTFHAIFSTANEDRHGDIVVQDWDLKSFKKNPVFLDSHNYDSIEHILGKINNLKQEKVLEGDIEFFVENPKGLLAKQAAEGGFLNATSVGFIPKQFDDKGRILKSELLEVSGVSVPANAEALFSKSEDQGEEEDKAPAPVEEPVIEEEPTIETPIVESKRKKLSAIIKGMVKDNETKLKLLAKAVEELTEENRQSKKKEIHQIIRGLLKEGTNIG